MPEMPYLTPQAIAPRSVGKITPGVYIPRGSGERIRIRRVPIGLRFVACSALINTGPNT